MTHKIMVEQEIINLLTLDEHLSSMLTIIGDWEKRRNTEWGWDATTFIQYKKHVSKYYPNYYPKLMKLALIQVTWQNKFILDIKYKKVPIPQTRKVSLTNFSLSVPHLTTYVDNVLHYVLPYLSPTKVMRVSRFDNSDGCVTLELMTTTQCILRHKDTSVCAINLANAHHPCGGYLHGAIAQEEDLCREFILYSSSLLRSKRQLYPLRLGEANVTRVPYIDRLATEGYKLITSTSVANIADYTFAHEILFVAVAGPNWNKDDDHSVDEMIGPRSEKIGTIRNKFERSIPIFMNAFELLFKSAIYYRCRVVIIGALGCGAFAPRDPTERENYILNVAYLIRLICEVYKPSFDNIIMAIMPGDVATLYNTYFE